MVAASVWVLGGGNEHAAWTMIREWRQPPRMTMTMSKSIAP